MKIEIINNSKLKHAYLLCDGKRYSLSDSSTTEIEVVGNNAEIKVEIKDKNRVYVDFLDLFFNLLNPESSKCRITASYKFSVKSAFDCCSVTVNDLAADREKTVTIESVYADSRDADILDTDYILNDIKSAKKRYTLIQLLVLSSLPITVLLLVFSILKSSFILFLVFLLGLFFLVIPSIRKVRSFNEICTDAKSILMNAEENKRNGIQQ